MKNNEGKKQEGNTDIKSSEDVNLSRRERRMMQRKLQNQQTDREERQSKKHGNSEKQESRKPILLYDRIYKKLLIIPILLLVISLVYLGYFYTQTGEIISRDVTLTGGTTVTVFAQTDISALKEHLKKNFDVVVREISDLRTREQKAFIVETTSNEEEIKSALEDYLGYELTEDNSTIEFTGSGLSQNFYKQLILSILLAFIFMGVVVFLIFGRNTKIKVLLIILSLIAPFLFFILKSISINTAFVISVIVLVLSILSYVIYSMPSFMVVLSAFADITMSLALVNLLGIKLSTAGIVAFLMLIGYSVDTDIMLTSRVLRGKEGSINSRLINSFETGITMTFTSMVAVFIALLLTSFSPVLKQIFTILLIGLSFDLVNTWVTNCSLLKWYSEKRK